MPKAQTIVPTITVLMDTPEFSQRVGWRGSWCPVLAASAGC